MLDTSGAETDRKILGNTSGPARRTFQKSWSCMNINPGIVEPVDLQKQAVVSR